LGLGTTNPGKKVPKKEPPAKTFEFDVVKINARGGVISNTRKQANYLVEDLGNGVTLEMVSIPGGAFLMGSPNNEVGRADNEGPPHRVTLPTFWMSKFPITQAQWQAMMGNNPSYFKGSLQLATAC
jgi:formylglycine-generating enzyme required for sulfatase activity